MEGYAVRFHDPVWAWGFLALPVIFALAWWGVSRGAASMRVFLSSHTAPRLVDQKIYRRRKIGVALLTLALAALVGALIRPQYGVKPVQVKRSGIDIMILLDTSKSMNARDVKPSRFKRAQIEMGKIVAALEGNRIGLISFAGSSFVECPLTTDIATVKLFLDTIRVGSIPVPGTAIGKALEDAAKAFEASKAKTKAVILVTDGENLSGEVKIAAEKAAEKGLTVFPIGIGTVAGAPIPELDENGDITGYKKNKEGETIISRLDSETLREVAEITGGVMISSAGGGLDITGLMERLKNMEKTDITSQEYTEYEERYQWFVLAALVPLLLEFFLLSGRRKEVARKLS